MLEETVTKFPVNKRDLSLQGKKVNIMSIKYCGIVILSLNMFMNYMHYETGF